MSGVEAFILGLVQGLTEFLPVSSSGHLELAKAVLGGEAASDSLAFTIVVHFATALSTLTVFRKDIARLVAGLLKINGAAERAFSLKIVLSMIPAALVGLFFESEIDRLFQGRLPLVGAMLLVSALLLFLADASKRDNRPLSYSKALQVGIAQAIAIIPGISRSGATISVASLLGVERAEAARFSFLMVVPLIFGSMAKSTLDHGLSLEGIPVSSLLIGFVTAFAVGCLACRWMIQIVKRSKLRYFGAYCLLVGGVAIAYSIFA